MELVERSQFRIVHIEDDFDFTELAGRQLKRAGFLQPIQHYTKGNQALEFLSRVYLGQAPHAILIDLHLPGMNGFDILRWLRHDYCDPGVAAYLLTSSQNPDHRRQAADAGATKYLAKGVDFGELIEELDQAGAMINHRRFEEKAVRDGDTMAELALMSEYSPYMVVLTDAEGRVEWVNQPFIQTCGYSLEEVRGIEPGRLLQGPESDRSAIEMLHNAVRSRSTCECCLINYKKNGTAYPVQISLGPVFHNGEIEGFLAVEKDLS